MHWGTFQFPKRRRPAALADCRPPPCKLAPYDSIACLAVVASVESHHDWLDACCEGLMVHTSPSRKLGLPWPACRLGIDATVQTDNDLIGVPPWLSGSAWHAASLPR